MTSLGYCLIASFVFMSDSASQTISLNDIGIRYIQSIQRLSDIMVIHWAGFRTLNEQTFDDLAKTIPGLPATDFRLPFEVAKQEADFMLLKQTINEILSLSMIFLEDARKILALIEFNAARANSTGDLVSLAAEVNANTSGLDLATRFKQLTERYGIQSPFEAPLMSLHFIGRFLFQASGFIGQNQSATLHLKVIQPPGEGESQPRAVDYKRTWTQGERILLSRDEHAAIFTTVSLFFGETLREVQEFAKRSGLPDEPVQQ